MLLQLPESGPSSELSLFSSKQSARSPTPGQQSALGHRPWAETHAPWVTLMGLPGQDLARVPMSHDTLVQRLIIPRLLSRRVLKPSFRLCLEARRHPLGLFLVCLNRVGFLLNRGKGCGHLSWVFICTSWDAVTEPQRWRWRTGKNGLVDKVLAKQAWRFWF